MRKLFKFSYPLCNENLNSFLTRWGNYSRRGNYSREETIWGNTVCYFLGYLFCYCVHKIKIWLMRFFPGPKSRIRQEPSVHHQLTLFFYFSWCYIENAKNFKRTEDRATVFLKWANFRVFFQFICLSESYLCWFRNRMLYNFCTRFEIASHSDCLYHTIGLSTKPAHKSWLRELIKNAIPYYILLYYKVLDKNHFSVKQ